MKELGEELHGKSKKRSRLSKKTKTWFKRVIISLLFLSSLGFYFGLVQPTMVDEIGARSAKLLSTRLVDFQNATNLTAATADRFNNFIVEYARQDCDVPVVFDLAKTATDVRSAQIKLQIGAEDVAMQKYAFLYSKDIQSIITSTNNDLQVVTSKIDTILTPYAEIDSYALFLKSLRTTCSEITSVTPNKLEVLNTSCQKITDALNLFLVPKSAWIKQSRDMVLSYTEACKKDTTYTQVLNNFIPFFSKLTDNAPDMTKVRSDNEDYYNEAAKIVAINKDTIKTTVSKKSTVSGIWYFLDIKL